MPSPPPNARIVDRRYAVGRVIAQSELAIVLEATDVKKGRMAAVAMLRPRLKALPTAVRRFVEETHAAVGDHPEVARIHPVRRLADGTPYIAIEYRPVGERRERAAPRSPGVASERLRVAGGAVGVVCSLLGLYLLFLPPAPTSNARRTTQAALRAQADAQPPPATSAELAPGWVRDEKASKSARNVTPRAVSTARASRHRASKSARKPRTESPSRPRASPPRQPALPRSDAAAPTEPEPRESTRTAQRAPSTTPEVINAPRVPGALEQTIALLLGRPPRRRAPPKGL